MCLVAPKLLFKILRFLGIVFDLMSLGVKEEMSDHENNDDEMGPPSHTTGGSKLKVKPSKAAVQKGAIVNISSPFKENVYKDNGSNSPF